MFSSIWRAIKRFFGSNKLVLQVVIQALAGEFFKKHPKYKAMVGQMLNDAVMTITGDAMSLGEARKSIHVRINALGSTPAEKALMTGLIDSLFVEIERNVTAEKITGIAAQTQVVVQTLRWVVDASKF